MSDSCTVQLQCHDNDINYVIVHAHMTLYRLSVRYLLSLLVVSIFNADIRPFNSSTKLLVKCCTDKLTSTMSYVYKLTSLCTVHVELETQCHDHVHCVAMGCKQTTVQQWCFQKTTKCQCQVVHVSVQSVGEKLPTWFRVLCVAQRPSDYTFSSQEGLAALAAAR